MRNNVKQLSNPFSTGGGGINFETRIQAFFVVLMLTGDCSLCLPNRQINKIKLQGRFAGFQTDDLIVFTHSPSDTELCKLLGQIKHSIKITENDTTFGEVIQSAWNDFQNTNLFNKGRDAIALITGPLSATDTNDVRHFLEWARHAENSDEFFKKVELSNFSNDAKRRKLKAFKTNLKKANSGIEVTKQEFFEFLRHFHLLGYDLDIKNGVTWALLYSLIGRYSDDTQAIWAKIVVEVQSFNQNAGTITVSNIPEDISSVFRQHKIKNIPPEFAIPTAPKSPNIGSNTERRKALLVSTLLGKWNETNDFDKDIIERCFSMEFSSWIDTLREVIQEKNSPLTFHNGRWEVAGRKQLWDAFGSRIFDSHLEQFKKCAVDVLTELDPKFELPAEERSFVNIYSNVLKYSPALRMGMAETLALLGNQGACLVRCTQHKPETIAVLAIREILGKAKWQQWASLNDLLPTLVEAAPDEFLNSVEYALKQQPCPFDEIFAQERIGIGGSRYMTGLLWALEGLSWSEEHLGRATGILAELASHDPGGNSLNRSINSLTTILLPWFPQTMASVDKRITSIKAIIRDFPDIAWELLLSLLPNQHQISLSTHKPRWSNVLPENWEKKVTNKEYRKQVTQYAGLAVEMSFKDLRKLKELVRHLDNLPKPSFDAILEHLSSAEIVNLPETAQMPIWLNLTDFAAKHRKFSEAGWALDGKDVSKIEAAADKLSPSSPEGIYRRLFNDNEFDLYEKNGDWKEQSKKLDKRRKQAIQEILDSCDLQGVIAFIDAVESPNQVGRSLGMVATNEIDSDLLPKYLDSENIKYQQFTDGFVWSRYQCQGWKWVDGLDKTDWTLIQTRQFLMYLPFKADTWHRANKWLGDAERMYWENVPVTSYLSASDSDSLHAIDKLLEVSHPHAAIVCLYYRLHKNWPTDSKRTVRALLDAVSVIKQANTMDSYYIIELIKALQNDCETDQNDLFKVEWIYLLLLDGHNGAYPKSLEMRLASHPDFFCEVIRLIFRSKNEEAQVKKPEKLKEPAATNAWRLLYKWKRPPGLHDDGSFSVKDFKAWLKSVKEQCRKSGHLEVALIKVGEVLFYSPTDSQGLWIIRDVASALNARDAEDMRRGFSKGAFNSRGAHTIDPTGDPERKLAVEWLEKSVAADDAGFARFAATLRKLSENYEREANQIVEEYKIEQN